MRSGLVLVLGVALAACGEPPIAVEIPARESGQQVLDLAGVVGPGVALRLEAIREDEGLDLVALTYETTAASCGEAFRAGGAFVQEWQADVAIVAVARPGDFASTDEEREACFDIQPRDERAVPGSLRQEIVEQQVPPLTEQNRWAEAFHAAAERLAEELS